MLDDLKDLFSRSWDAFRAEAGRRDPEDQVSELLSAMRRELVEAKAHTPVLEEAHRRATMELAVERRHLEDTLRRKGQAERIGDAETVRVATEFAEKHAARVAVLEEKVRAARAEWDLHARESDEMMRRFKEADANRFALLAEIRRRGAASTLGLGGTPGSTSSSSSSSPGLGGRADARLSEIERMKEKLREKEAYAEALEELEREMGGGAPPPPPPPRPTYDVDQRLEELKRKMRGESA